MHLSSLKAAHYYCIALIVLLDSIRNSTQLASTRGTSRTQRTSSNIDPAMTTEATAPSTAAPLYITIGPQCCGKSTILKELHGGTIKDVCLDDQQDVYVPVPTEYFFLAGDGANTEESRKVLGQVYQGKTLEERIRNDNTELRLILRRWKGDLTPAEFEQGVKEYHQGQGYPSNVADALIAAVETFLKRKSDSKGPRSLPKTIDVFILESLFRPHPQTNQSAIQKAHDELRTTPTNIPLAWGNTNSKSRDYSQVLDIAFQKKRPVRFILCHPGIQREQDAGVDAPLITMPWVDLPELLKRNLKRLKKTGRYIPAFAVADCSQRVESLVTVRDDTENGAVEKRLVSLGSPPPPRQNFANCRGNGRHHQQRNQQPPFRYVLNDQGLIQKIFNNNNNNSRGRNHHSYSQHQGQNGSTKPQWKQTQQSPSKRRYKGNATQQTSNKQPK